MPEKTTIPPSELAGAIASIFAVASIIFFSIRAEVRWRIAVNADRKNLKKEKASQDDFAAVKKDVVDLLTTRRDNPRVTAGDCLRMQQHNAEIITLRLAEGEKKFDTIMKHYETVSGKQDKMLDMIVEIYKEHGHGQWDGKDRRDEL